LSPVPTRGRERSGHRPVVVRIVALTLLLVGGCGGVSAPPPAESAQRAVESTPAPTTASTPTTPVTVRVGGGSLQVAASLKAIEVSGGLSFLDGVLALAPDGDRCVIESTRDTSLDTVAQVVSSCLAAGRSSVDLVLSDSDEPPVSLSFPMVLRPSALPAVRLLCQWRPDGWMLSLLPDRPVTKVSAGASAGGSGAVAPPILVANPRVFPSIPSDDGLDVAALRAIHRAVCPPGGTTLWHYVVPGDGSTAAHLVELAAALPTVEPCTSRLALIRRSDPTAQDCEGAIPPAGLPTRPEGAQPTTTQPPASKPTGRGLLESLRTPNNP